MIDNDSMRAFFAAAVLTLAAMVGGSAMAAQPEGETVLRERCLLCHTEGAGSEDRFSRISGQRKSPEGWQMTLNRMQHQRGQELQPDEKRALIKYLSDTQGLAPAESAPYRYLLEQDTNRVEEIDPAYAEMCARCHSAARFALQRRNAEEWRLLVHFHMGQHPTLELHALSRDRPWMRLALDETVPQLAKDFPLVSAQWQDWQKAAKPALQGSWRVLGYVPGKGEFDARMTAVATAPDRYAVQLEGRYLDGTPVRGEGSATVFTGYEWRASVKLDGVQMRQVMAAAPDGQSMTGRQFMRDAREMGGELRATREGEASQVLAVRPSHVRKGAPATLTIIGSRLDGTPALGDGVKVVRVEARTAERITLVAEADGATGLRDVTVGKARGKDLLAVYDRVARVDLVPGDAVARIGGSDDDPGAQMEKVRVVFRAVGYAAGPDGKPGTDDDIPLGHVPATWSIEPLNDAAAAESDHLFAGSIDPNGVFTPAHGGPNPRRHMSANNVGMLSVVAQVGAGDEAVRGRSRLLVAVPDFVRRVLD